MKPKMWFEKSMAAVFTSLAGCALLMVGTATPLLSQVPGTVVAFGDNVWGQLGNGSTQDSAVPVQVLKLSGVADIAAGGGHSLALLRNGEVYAWGKNDSGQLGNGCTVNVDCKDSTVRVQVRRGGQPLRDVIAVAAGFSHSMALTSRGNVWAWGNNSSGQLGDLTTISRSNPEYVQSFIGILAGVRTIAAGGSHSLAALANGSLRAWGNNTFGQLGDGTFNFKTLAFPVQIVSGITGVAAGSWHSFARKVDGTVFAWGRNNRGQLGDGGFGDSNLPLQVSMGVPHNIVGIAAGRGHSLALKLDGTVWTWGRNAQGQLGRLTSAVNDPVPGQLTLTDVATISAGGNHSLAAQREGEVWAWGSNAEGQLGLAKPVIYPEPALVKTLNGVTTVAAGLGHSLVAKIPWTMWTWGGAGLTQGNGAYLTRDMPGQVNGPTWAVGLAAGGVFSLALAPTGRVWAWGHNGKGQLGDGGSSFDGAPFSPVPVQVRLGNKFLSGIRKVAAGGGHGMALHWKGRVLTWGWNAFGQLGDGTTVDKNLPTAVPIKSVVAIAGGGEHSLAQTKDGKLWAWGSNYGGQLGTGGPPAIVTTPQPVGLKGVVSFVGGDGHTLAILSDGTVWAWGSNANGQLGDGCKINVNCANGFLPAPVLGLKDVVEIAAGATGSMALKSDGTVWAWGWNGAGQLGDGCQIGLTCVDSSVPVQVPGLPPIVSIGSGAYGRLAAAADGTLWVWGDGSSVPQPVLRVDGLKIAVGGFNAHNLIAFPNPF